MRLLHAMLLNFLLVPWACPFRLFYMPFAAKVQPLDVLSAHYRHDAAPVIWRFNQGIEVLPLGVEHQPKPC
jgi:hypothetical protein